MSGNKSVRPATQTELDNLYEVFAKLATSGDAAALLEDMCTIREIDEMSQRLEVARLLSIRTPYLVITEKTGASATTISRVAKALNHGAGGYLRALNSQS